MSLCLGKHIRRDNATRRLTIIIITPPTPTHTSTLYHINVLHPRPSTSPMHANTQPSSPGIFLNISASVRVLGISRSGLMTLVEAWLFFCTVNIQKHSWGRVWPSSLTCRKDESKCKGRKILRLIFLNISRFVFVLGGLMTLGVVWLFFCIVNIEKHSWRGVWPLPWPLEMMIFLSLRERREFCP